MQHTVIFSAITIDQEGRAMETRVAFYTIDSTNVSAERVRSSLLTFQELRANNTSSIRSNSKECEEKDTNVFFLSSNFISLLLLGMIYYTLLI